LATLAAEFYRRQESLAFFPCGPNEIKNLGAIDRVRNCEPHQGIVSRGFVGPEGEIHVLGGHGACEFDALVVEQRRVLFRLHLLGDIDFAGQQSEHSRRGIGDPGKSNMLQNWGTPKMVFIRHEDGRVALLFDKFKRTRAVQALLEPSRVVDIGLTHDGKE
jgi:hypothetical protein